MCIIDWATDASVFQWITLPIAGGKGSEKVEEKDAERETRERTKSFDYK